MVFAGKYLADFARQFNPNVRLVPTTSDTAEYVPPPAGTIMSPVGVNEEIVQDGLNGYLASTDDDWVEKLSALIESQELRRRIGVAARETVEAFYSVKSQQEPYLTLLRRLLDPADA